MTEIKPGVWRLCVYAGRRANGTPIKLLQTLRTHAGRKGAGRGEAEVALADMLAKVSKGAAAGSETVNDLLDLWFDHLEFLGRSPRSTLAWSI